MFDIFSFFFFFAQNIDCGYTLEPPRKHRLWVLVRTASQNRLGEAVLTSTHNLCFGGKIRKIGIPYNPHFFYIKAGLRGHTLHGHVFMMSCFVFLCYLTSGKHVHVMYTPLNPTSV